MGAVYGSTFASKVARKKAQPFAGFDRQAHQHEFA